MVITMNRIEIEIKKLNALVVPRRTMSMVIRRETATVLSLNAEFMRLGYCMSRELVSKLEMLYKDELVEIANGAINVLRKMKGDDVDYKPMYPNFPEQVMEMEETELYLNALLHYWSDGRWSPVTHELNRMFAFESTSFEEIGYATEANFSVIFPTILSSNDSISEFDKGVIEWFLTEYDQWETPKNIPFKENMCLVGAMALKHDHSISQYVKTATDILRIVTHMSEGDVSLATNTKFKSIPRRQRRAIVSALNCMLIEEDIARHRNKWNRLFHMLHIGEFGPGHVMDVVNKVRENKKLETMAGKVEAFLKIGNTANAVELLKNRPGDFARRLDHMLRLTDDNVHRSAAVSVLTEFDKVTDRVSTRVLAQLLGHFKARNSGKKRVVFPKGPTARATLLDAHSNLHWDTLDLADDVVRAGMRGHFAGLEKLGKVFVEPEMASCPLPAAQRSASEALKTVSRGTRLPITADNDKNTLRFFIYWIGQDIDLSASFHDENFNMIRQVSWTALRDKEFSTCHSGDITHAPNGAAEFIDVDMEKLRAGKSGCRYIVMNVYVYSGPNFSEHEKCYAGWMMRDKPNSNAIFDPKTVVNKMDLTSDSRSAIPVIFDVLTGEAIWTDLTLKRHPNWKHAHMANNGNTVETNRVGIGETIESMISLDNKPTLHDLFTLHGEARGEIVDSPEEADVVFGWNGQVTPYDINKINADFLA